MNDITPATLSEMTDRNMHTEAYIAGCRYLSKIARTIEGSREIERLETLTNTSEQFRHILEEQNKVGHLPCNLATPRYRLYKLMMSVAHNMLHPDDYEEFYQAF